ncbi:unnamed protein product, partial [Acidithrix sp. C25]
VRIVITITAMQASGTNRKLMPRVSVIKSTTTMKNMGTQLAIIIQLWLL